MKHARLFINDTEVGSVALRHSADSWGMGDFVPNDAFTRFAPLFGAWSLIMHEDDGGGRIDAAILEELHRAEAALDKLRVKLRRTDRDEWIDVDQVVIDGPMIEWRIMGHRGRTINAAGTSRRSRAQRPRAAG